MIASTAVEIVAVFDPAGDGLAEKSRELTLGLLADTPSPFSRDQYTPGHITCTALVFHPRGQSVLVMHHHRLKRWLLPGGHLEPEDPGLADAAAREAREETCVELDARRRPFLVGIDVHGIPPRKAEPFHFHHDLIWCFRAISEQIVSTDEAPEVLWASPTEWKALGLAPSIQNSVWRAQESQ
jgi:8-oxo-dGTP pyrophosphatase MutT (NUDIX family)